MPRKEAALCHSCAAADPATTLLTYTAFYPRRSPPPPYAIFSARSTQPLIARTRLALALIPPHRHAPLVTLTRSTSTHTAPLRSVQYQVNDPQAAFYKLTNSHTQISTYVFDVVRAR